MVAELCHGSYLDGSRSHGIHGSIRARKAAARKSDSFSPNSKAKGLRTSPKETGSTQDSEAELSECKPEAHKDSEAIEV